MSKLRIRPNPLRTDPTRTGTQQRLLEREIINRFKKIQREIVHLVVTQDVFGLREPTFNAGPNCGTGAGGFKPGNTCGKGGAKDGDAYFTAKSIKQVGGYKSREILVHMSPDDFLSIAEEGADEYKAATVSRVLKSGEQFPDLPHLGFTHDGKGNAVVVSHEGRHRARALKELGVKELPVILRSQEQGQGQGIRWSEQDIEGFDKIKGEWPKTLKGQERPTSIPFPVADMRTGVTANFRAASAQVNIDDPVIITRLLEIQNAIDPADILKLETEPHVTIRYGLDDVGPERVEHIIDQYRSIQVKFKSLSAFANEKEDVLKIDVDGNQLRDLNRHLGILPNQQTHRDYKPHLTIAYLKPGTGKKYVGRSGLEDVELTLKSVMYSDLDRNKTEIVLNAWCPTGKGGGKDNSCSPRNKAYGVDAKLWEDAGGNRRYPELQLTSIVQGPIRMPPPGVETAYTVRNKMAGGGEPYTNLPVVEVRIDDLMTGQSMVEGSRIRKYDATTAPPIHVMMWGGQMYIMQGNHRAAAAWSEGVDTIKAKVIDLNDPKFQKYLQPKIRKRLKESGQTTSNEFLGRGATGPITTNAVWKFLTLDQKLKEFTSWIQAAISTQVLAKSALLSPDPENHWLSQHIQRTFTQGMSRAYDMLKKPQLQEKLDFFQGSKAQFLADSFLRPVSQERVKLLASRAFGELRGVTDQMATQMQRTLTDGFIRGNSPWEIARNLSKDVDNIGHSRAKTIARTEVVRAHNEGQLETMENLGVDKIGVAVEWSTSGLGITKRGNPTPCRVCAPLKGVVFSLKEARGMLPRHPNCMCSWIPANTGESTMDQIRSKSRVQKAIDKSLTTEIPKKSKLTIAKQKKHSSWPGAVAKIGKKRPKNIFGKSSASS